MATTSCRRCWRRSSSGTASAATSSRTSGYDTRSSALAAAALLGPLELAPHLAVLRDRVGLVRSRIEVRRPLLRIQPRKRLSRSLRIARNAGALHLLDRARELRVLTLESGLRGPLHQSPHERQLHQSRQDRLQVPPALNAAEEREHAEHEEQAAEDVQREEVEPDRAGHVRIVAAWPCAGLPSRVLNTAPWAC